MKKPLLIIALFFTLLTALRFNVHRFTARKGSSNLVAANTLKVGYLPVTCHLTCPVTDFATKTSPASTRFVSTRFSDFPTVASAVQSGNLQATFMVAPLALKLREEGVPIKICYLGHREGSQLVVHKNSSYQSLRDLKGKKIAIPSIYSNQHFVLSELLLREGMSESDVTFIPLPPPDMPTSLAAHAIDAYFVGEPFCAKAEMEQIGRSLFFSGDLWPNFISCVLVVHENLINEKPEVVRDLVRGIAESGAWAEEHREEAAKIAAQYYGQKPELLRYVLTANPRRVKYTGLFPGEEEIQKIVDIGRRIGLLKTNVAARDILDTRFIPTTIKPADIQVNDSL